MSAEPPAAGGPLEVGAAMLGDIAARGIAVPRYERTALQRRIVHIGAKTLAEPAAFLEFARVFPPGVGSNERFRSSFVAAYRAIADAGPLAAMERTDGA
jgi:mannitol-1-phosphate/altronate dehydrogenase